MENEKKSVVIEWDRGEDSVKGLHLKISAAGRRSFYLSYRNKQGVQRRPKIGDENEVNLAAARTVARGWWLKIAAGEDPSEERMRERGAQTMNDLFEMAKKEHWSEEKYQNSGWADEAERIWEKILKKRFGNLKLTELTAPIIREWHRQLKGTPNKANRSKAVLSKLLSIAEEKGLREPQSNPCFSVPNFPEKERRRVANTDELKKIVAILEREKESHPREVAFIYLLMFTGSRPSSIERALRSEVSTHVIDGVTTKTLTRVGKTGNEVVVIPPQIVPIIEALPERKDGKLLGIRLPKSFWVRVRSEAGCDDLWARDFRRTFASIGLGVGVPLDQIGRTLNHASQQTTLRYAHLVEGPRIQTVSKIADALTDILEEAPVVSAQKGRATT